MTKKYLITSALPYGNGPIHLGHMLEHIQTDIWVKFLRSQNYEVIYICADDAHGAPILIKAQKDNIDPEVMIKRIQQEHIKTLQDFNINHTNYYTTHSDENKELVEEIYSNLLKDNLIFKKKIKQLFDKKQGMFLADRFVTGTCPACGANSQFGDGCEVCGITYEAEELINPISTLTNTTPVLKKTEHLYFKLNTQSNLLGQFLEDSVKQKAIKRKLNEWLDGELADWNISRDAPYFGFEIPNEKDKFFYVWLDAPIGYIASTKNYCDKNKKDFMDIWNKKSDYEIHHFIGKDIIYFHGLFWPAVLNASKYKLPNSIHAHGFLSINGQKMSKSKGTFITADQFREKYEPDLLRFYFASKLNSKIEDIDLDLKDFTNKINSSLVGKIFNIGSRIDSFIKNNGYILSDRYDQSFVHSQREQYNKILENFLDKEFSKAVNLILRIADSVNSYINEKKPWKLDNEKALLIATTSLNIYRDICILLSPITPKLSEKALEQFEINKFSFRDLENDMLGIKINKYKVVIERIEEINLDHFNGNKMTVHSNKEISIEDFAKIDLRVAKIISAENVDGADKLIKIELDVGVLGSKTVFAGIKVAYQPKDLIDRNVVLVNNLRSRKMKFGISEGMILASSNDEGGIFLLSSDNGAKPGEKVK